MSFARVAVIGAGLSGLACARALASAGTAVTVFEKSRSFGGRCATRRWDGHVVDHGAQFFTMRDPAFRSEVERLCGAGLRELTAPVVDERGATLPGFSARHYLAGGNNQLGRALALPLDIRLEVPVTPPRLTPSGWSVADERFEAVVSSAPAPQTRQLLGLAPPESGAFVPCLTALFAYEGEPSGPAVTRYARSAPTEPLMWSACENHKSGRVLAGTTVFVAQGSPEFSAAHLEERPESWALRLQIELEKEWHLEPRWRLGSFTHRWRYARRVAPADFGELPPRFFVTGDNRAESRVEAAWLAGQATAREVLEAL